MYYKIFLYMLFIPWMINVGFTG